MPQPRRSGSPRRKEMDPRRVGVGPDEPPAFPVVPSVDPVDLVPRDAGIVGRRAPRRAAVGRSRPPKHSVGVDHQGEDRLILPQSAPQRNRLVRPSTHARNSYGRTVHEGIWMRRLDTLRDARETEPHEVRVIGQNHAAGRTDRGRRRHNRNRRVTGFHRRAALFRQARRLSHGQERLP